MALKRIIMIIIDSLMSEPLNRAIADGKVPAIAFLKENGMFVPNVVSSFPTMSVSIDSSLLTGVYPDQHKIPGLIWFDGSAKNIVSYGNGKVESLKLGLNKVVNYSLYELNHQHLSKSVETIYEVLAKEGLQAASINGLIYRGNTTHKLKVPILFKLLKSVRDHITIKGPNYFSLGGLSHTNPNNRLIWPAFGVCDRFSAKEIRYLIQTRKLPSFTLVYLPDNDHVVHKYGPQTTKGLMKLDKQLQYMLDSYPTWEQAIEETIWIVMGDSGQTKVKEKRKEALIPLEKLLGNYTIARLGKKVEDTDQIVLCANERMAYIYLLDKKLSVQQVSDILQKDNRIDIIAFKEENRIRILSGDKSGSMTFKSEGTIRDEYGQTWSVEGEASLLDLTIQDNEIVYGQYPDVLARIYGSMHSHEGDFIVITAKPGYEIVAESSPNHLGGGSHGSLHEQDSLVPLIVAGTQKLPSHRRIVDLKRWILELTKEGFIG